MSTYCNTYTYTCFFCGETQTVEYEKEPIYHILLTQEGDKHIDMCPRCMSNLRSLLFNMRKELSEYDIWKLLNSEERTKVTEGLKYLNKLPVRKSTLLQLERLKNWGGEIEEVIKEYLKIYKPCIVKKEYANE